MRVHLVFPLLSLALLGCPPKGQQGSPPPPTPATQPGTSTTTSMKGSDPAQRDQTDPDGVVRRGTQLSHAKAMTVSEVLAQADGLAGKSVKVTGTVGKVCEKKGCWFVIAEAGDHIRITAKDYGFFVPSQAPGMTATIEGELTVKTLSEADAEHLKAEGAKIDDLKEVSLTAAALEMKRAG